MKKISIVCLALVLIFSAFSLNACGEDPLYKTASADEAATEDSKTVDINDFEKTFDGMQKYLIACKLLPDPDSKENAKKGDLKSDMYAGIIGAKQGVRYTLSSSAFIEFYEYDTENNNATADQVTAQLNKDGTFKVAEELETLTGKFSDSGNFLAVYNSTIKYDYDKILEEFKKF